LGFFYSPKDFATVVKEIKKLSPDVICFAGDFLNSATSLDLLETTIAVLAEMKAPFGKYAVLGNHDYHSGFANAVRSLECGGFRVLRNDHTVSQRENDRLFLSGLDNISEGRPNLESAIKGIPENACNILLVHEPDIADYTSKFPIDLQLSGHSHGGQVCLPFVGPIITTKLGEKYPTGLYKINELMLYTNRGLGTTVLPVRFFCRPEITIITLLHKCPVHCYRPDMRKGPKR
jgi:hypothetical protein